MKTPNIWLAFNTAVKRFICVLLGLLATSLIPRSSFGEEAPLPNSFPAAKPAKPRSLPFVVSKETTYLTAPLKADGTVDYQSALESLRPPKVPAEKNKLAGLVELIDFQSPFFHRLECQDVRQAVGLAVRGKQTDYLVPFDEFLYEKLARHRRREPLMEGWDHLHRDSWTALLPDDLDVLAETWLGEQEEVYRRLHAALARPDCYLPIVKKQDRSLAEAAFPSERIADYAAKYLNVHARLSFRTGKFDLVERDLRGIFDLAAMLDRGGLQGERNVAESLRQIGCDGLKEWIQSGQMSLPAARRWSAYLTGQPPRPSQAEIWNLGERYVMLDLLQNIAVRRRKFSTLGFILLRHEGEIPNHALAASTEDPTGLIQRLGLIDWNQVLRIVNVRTDDTVKALREPTFARRKAALESLQSKEFVPHSGQLWPVIFQISAGRSPKQYFTRFAANRLLGSFGMYPREMIYTGTYLEVQEQLISASLAATAFRGEHGRYPAKLEELVPKYLPKLPLDPFSGKPLVYRCKDDRFGFYSVGENGKDEGGRDDLIEDNDDIHFGKLFEDEDG